MPAAKPEVFMFEDGTPLVTRGQGRKVFWAFVGFTSVWLVWCSISVPRRFTCAACRMDRVQHGFLGFRWSSFGESECSRWYAANVERSHKHIWASCSHCQRFGIPGIYGGFACSSGKPISELSKSVQVRIYQKFPDPMQAKRLFVRLGEWSRENRRLMEGLCEWADAGGPESWDEWWPKHHEG